MVAVPSSFITGAPELTAIHTDRLAVHASLESRRLSTNSSAVKAFDDTQPAERLLDLADELPHRFCASRLESA